MILEYNGDKVDYFEIIFSDFKFKPWGEDELKPVRKIGIWLSGGADSAFTFWYMAKCIDDNKLYHYSLIPIHGHDEARKMVDSRIPTLNIIEYVKNEFPNVNIKSPHIFSYYKEPKEGDKGQFHLPQQDYLRKNYIIDISVNSMTANPPLDALDDSFRLKRDPKRDTKSVILAQETILKKGILLSQHRPFELVNKKFISHFYNKFGLSDLFKMTVSCTGGYDADKEKKFPCQECWWCFEKYWAFGMYDGGAARYNVIFKSSEDDKGKVVRQVDGI
jgi:hypothetical protein